MDPRELRQRLYALPRNDVAAIVELVHEYHETIRTQLPGDVMHSLIKMVDGHLLEQLLEELRRLARPDLPPAEEIVRTVVSSSSSDDEGSAP